MIARALFFVGLLSALGSAVHAQPDATPTPVIPMLERCQQFCASVYKDGSNAHRECMGGCQEADVCMSNCRSRFPDAQSKQGNCFKRCMEKGRPFEPASAPDLPRL